MTPAPIAPEPSMQNRELSWLKFNERVLREANRPASPLLERLKFISIFASNLDEFFMVRVGTLMDYAMFDDDYIDNKTGMDAQEQLGEIFRAVSPLYEQVGRAFASVREGLALHSLHLLGVKELDPDDIDYLKRHFTHNVLPLLSPQIIDSRHPFPHLANKQLHVAVMLEKKKGPLYGLIAMPQNLTRLVSLDGSGRFVLLEDLIWLFADLVFTGYNILEKNIIAVTRNADINTEEDLLDEDIDYRSHMTNLIKRRQRLSPVRLELAYLAGYDLLTFFCDKLSLSLAQTYYSTAPLDLSFCFSLDKVIGKDAVGRLIWPAHIPAETIPSAKKTDMLRLASGKDMLFSYPFESISPFLAMIRQAAEDVSVLSIKITLYRIDVQSKLAEALILAAENGKEVIVLMELRARFDEKNNIEWAQRLEEAGCRVIYGLVGFKVHSKVCLITRREHGKIHYITQIGTGNYNERTAKLYTDLSLVTSDQVIGRDAMNFFGNLLLGNLEGSYERLWVAPGSFKSNILSHIEREKQKAKNGRSAGIIVKCNSLTDKEIIEALTAASRDGVKITMIVRGICCLIPGVEGESDNISVVSIVGKFLEHSRIFCFGTGTDRKIYISSADFMTRNTQRRVEVACPILDPAHIERISGMLDIILKDNTQAWDMLPDASYTKRAPSGEESVNSQAFFVQEAHNNVTQSAEKIKGKLIISFFKNIRNKIKGRKGSQ